MANRIVLAAGGLRGAVAFAQKVLARKSSIPVLEGLRIRAGGDVKVEATDLENRLEIALPRLGGDGAFEIVLPGRALADYLKGESGEEVTLSASDDGLSVELDHGRIVALDPDDFPSVPRHEFERVSSIEPADLERAMKAVYFARSAEVVRYALTGVLFETGKGKTDFNLVASDGKRLSTAPIQSTRAKGNLRSIVNPTAALLVSGLAKRAEGSVLVEIEKAGPDIERKALRFSWAGSSVMTTEMQGHFPDWGAVIPSLSGRTAFRVDPAALAHALAAVEVGVSEKNRAARFAFSGSKVALEARAAGKGEAKAEVAATGEGDAEIVLNVDYVSEYLASLPKKTSEIEILLAKKSDCAIFRIPDGRGVYVLMPLTITI